MQNQTLMSMERTCHHQQGERCIVDNTQQKWKVATTLVSKTEYAWILAVLAWHHERGSGEAEHVRLLQE